jgi:peroxin-5
MSNFVRDFVTGSDVCAPSDGAGPSNAMGSLVNTLLGSSSKTQEQLREVCARSVVSGRAAGASRAHLDDQASI